MWRNMCSVWRDMCSVEGQVWCGGTCVVCTNLKQINPPQWKHIMHRLLIPIGEVASIRIQYIHYQRVC